MYTAYIIDRKTGSTVRKYTRVQDFELAGEQAAVLYLASINNTTARIDTGKYDIRLTLNRGDKRHAFSSMDAFLYHLNHTNSEEFVGHALNAAILAVEEYRAEMYRRGAITGVEHDELAATLTWVEDDWYATPSQSDIDSTNILVRALVNLVANDYTDHMIRSLETNARIFVDGRGA